MRVAIRRPVIFLGVGILNTFLDFVFYSLLTYLFFGDKSSIWIAGIISGTVALFVAFLTHSKITWKYRTINLATMIRFLIATGFGMWVIRPILLVIFIRVDFIYDRAYDIAQWLHIPVSYGFVANTGAFALMTAVVLVYNFIVYDKFVFTKGRGASNESG